MNPLLNRLDHRDSISSVICNKISSFGGGRFIGIFCNPADVFFSIEPGRGVLVDARKPLIAFYEAVQRDPDAVYEELEKLKENGSSESAFKSVKSKWNGKDFGVSFAARLLYLNLTCVPGSFFVDVGHRISASFDLNNCNPKFPSLDSLRAASSLLKKVRLYTKDYSYILRAARRGDVVYADIPSWDSGQSYGGLPFSSGEHLRLSKLLRKVADRGVIVIASISDCDQVRTLYEHWADTEDVDGSLLIFSIGSYMERKQMSLF